ncbi:MAG: hypothetical protein AAF357_09850, partial [Verrucomicrobiota bacterium]
MTLDDIRKVLSLQAIEQADESQSILTDADYREASSHAGAPLPKKVERSEENQFLAQRADMLLIRTTSRFPEASRWANQLPSKQRLALFGLVFFSLAAIAGFLTNSLGPEKRINILSFPLLGIMLWSLLVYVREIVLLLKGGNPIHGAGLIELLQPALEQSPPANSNEKTALEGARTLFEKRWRKLNTPVMAARLKSILHVTALILAAAAITGMYVNGL